MPDPGVAACHGPQQLPVSHDAPDGYDPVILALLHEARHAELRQPMDQGGLVRGRGARALTQPAAVLEHGAPGLQHDRVAEYPCRRHRLARITADDRRRNSKSDAPRRLHERGLAQGSFDYVRRRQADLHDRTQAFTVSCDREERRVAAGQEDVVPSARRNALEVGNVSGRVSPRVCDAVAPTAEARPLRRCGMGARGHVDLVAGLAEHPTGGHD